RLPRAVAFRRSADRRERPPGLPPDQHRAALIDQRPHSSPAERDPSRAARACRIVRTEVALARALARHRPGVIRAAFHAPNVSPEWTTIRAARPPERQASARSLHATRFAKLMSRDSRHE